MRRFRDKRLYDRGTRYIWAKLPDEHGRIRPVTTKCTDEKAASAFCDEWERKAADPAYRRAAEARLVDCIEDFLVELRRQQVSAATYEVATIKLGHLLRLWSPAWPMLRIDADLVLRYIDTREGEGVKPITVKKELDHLRRMLAWARFRGNFPRDLATVIPPNYSSRHKPKTRCPSPEEVAALLRNLAPHRAAHVAFIAATGARRGESARAQRSDVDLKRLVVRIRGTKTERAADEVPITGLTYALVLFAIQNAPGDAPMFAPWGKYHRDIKAACVRAGIEPLSPNDLRRAFGKWHRDLVLRTGGSKESAAEATSLMLRHTTDKLAQTTYARSSASDVGTMFRALAPVSILSVETAETAQNEPNDPPPQEDQVSNINDIEASPARLERATPGLGNLRTADASSPRSVGNKLAHSRRRVRASASILTECHEFRARALRWLTRAA